MRTLLLPLSSVIFLCSLMFSELSAKEIDKTFDASPGGKLYLKTDAGRLDIRTHDADSVKLHVSIDGDNEEEFELEHDASDGNVNIKGRMKNRRGWGWGNRLRVEFVITVPKHYNLEMHTSGGSIDIEDLVGNVDAHTSGGSIEVGNINGQVELQTSGGSITTEAIKGPLNAHTSGGSIRVTIAEQLSEDAELSTSGGSITAYLVDNIQIDIDASTSGGRVRSDFDVNGRVQKKSIRGEINGGGPNLELHTSGGSISIKSL